MAPSPNRTHADRLTTVECTLDRIASDIESEKGTRARESGATAARIDGLERRILVHDRVVWMGLGALSVLNLVSIAVAIWSSLRP